VGAPWPFQRHGGNGGLSLRNPIKMAEVCTTVEYKANNHGNEDVFFANHLGLIGGKLAPREICARFSTESIFRLGTFGCHAIDRYLSPEQCHQIRNQYVNAVK